MDSTGGRARAFEDLLSFFLLGGFLSDFSFFGLDVFISSSVTLLQRSSVVASGLAAVYVCGEGVCGCVERYRVH